MRFLTTILLLKRQVRWLFRQDGRNVRFFPAGACLPGLIVTSRQRRRIEQHMPAVFFRLIAVAVAGNLVAAGGIVLWDRFVGYVDASAALAIFTAVFVLFAAILHGWLYLALRRVVRDRAP